MRRAFGLVALVALVAGACSDDDGDGEPADTSVAIGATLEITPLEGRPSAITFAAGQLWVADDERDVVLRLDPSDGRVLGEPIPVAADPVALAAEDRWVWVASASGSVTRIDVATNAVAGVLDTEATFVDVEVDRGVVWAADIDGGAVHELLAVTGEPVRSIPVPNGAVRLTATEQQLWVSNLDNTVTPIDRATGVVAAPVTVGTGPIGLDEADGVLWVANGDDDTVTRIELPSGAPQAIDAGDAPVAVEADGVDVWVLNQDDQTLQRLEVGEPVELGTRPRGMTLTDDSVWIVGVEPSVAVRARF